MDKEKKYETVGLNVIKAVLDISEPKLNIQKIAKESGVSRAWVYKYFGSTHEEVVDMSIQCLAPILVKLSKKRARPKTKTEWVGVYIEYLEETLQEISKYPELIKYYYYCLLFENNFTEKLKKQESVFLEVISIPRIMSAFKCNRAKAKSIASLAHNLRLGIMLSWYQEPVRSSAKLTKLLAETKEVLSSYYR